ncbi:hypothetical protein U9M48_011144 [Paspalum notatum var. saurae]|uniref:Uncharacterized protein n=1 Tax=Paspalum notatum var. saurae TaxID=547442 RepID=A0AAQ3SV25_PASNO
MGAARHGCQWEIADCNGEDGKMSAVVMLYRVELGQSETKERERDSLAGAWPFTFWSKPCFSTGNVEYISTEWSHSQLPSRPFVSARPNQDGDAFDYAKGHGSETSTEAQSLLQPLLSLKGLLSGISWQRFFLPFR